MKLCIGLLSFVIIGIAINITIAQQENPPSKHLMREDSAAVNALVMYPDTIRYHIFEACEYPAAIVSIATLQKKSSDDFTQFVSGYSKEEQEDFWDLSRYPDLVTKLVQDGKQSRDQINGILVDYPADIHETALKYGRDYFDQLRQMNDMQMETNDQFEKIIDDYPPEIQDALRDIIQYPEIISLLNDHLSLTVRVGDHFRRNPEAVIHRADSLNLALTRQNAENADEWKASLEQNPDEEQDLQNAANDYATDNGYTQEDEAMTPDPDQVANYTCRPYSYWFGYPTWYPYSYWYPYPFWFDCGFYHDRSGRVVIISTPSFYFTNWYFYYPEHWHHYPHLASAYIYHYYQPHRLAVGNSIIVHDWVRTNRNYLPKDFITNNARRPEVIRQVGQLSIDAQKDRGGKQVAASVRDQYFQKNRSNYPSLNADPKNRMEAADRQLPTGMVLQPPVKQPPVRIFNPMREPEKPTAERTPVQQQEKPPAERPPTTAQQPPDRVPTPPPVQQQERQSAARMTHQDQQPPAPPQRVSPPSYNFNQINKAQEYHRNVWEQTQPAPRPQPQPPSRFQQQEPVRQPPPVRPSPGKKN